MSSKINVLAPVKTIGCQPSHRTACVDIPDFVFQALYPSALTPMARVKNLQPNALLLEVNQRARLCGLKPGLRYGEALARVPQLRAEVISAQTQQTLRQQFADKLRAFSPDIEACPDHSGVFYASLKGLEQLYPHWQDWLNQVEQNLQQWGYQGVVVVGFRRFLSLAVARLRGQHCLLKDPQQEQALAERAPLLRLGLPSGLLGELEQLGITSLGPFLKLSPESLRDRFGPELQQWQLRAQDQRRDPVRVLPEIVPWRAEKLLDYGETQAQALLHHCHNLLQPLLQQLARRHLAVSQLQLDLQLVNGNHCQQQINLTEPSLELARIRELLALRLEGLTLESGVSEIALCLQALPAPSGQLQLFEEHSHREIQAANRALDRVRALLGEGAVLKAQLQEGHLPRANFNWTPLNQLQGRPAPRAPEALLIRRHFQQPSPLPAPRKEQILSGPFRISGGWWHRLIERDYHYLWGAQGQLLWAYFDQSRQSWLQEGLVD